MTDNNDALKALDRLLNVAMDHYCRDSVNLAKASGDHEIISRALTPSPDAGVDCILAWMENEEANYTAEELRAMAKKARSLLVSAKKQGWQPIETAPRDGTKIILWSKECGEPNGCIIAAWDGERSFPYLPCNWTKWRPLPPPPPKEER
jgi:hypothetical protein